MLGVKFPFGIVCAILFCSVTSGVLLGEMVRLMGVSHRWEWWLASPNDLAAIIAALLPFFMCGLAYVYNGKNIPYRWLIMSAIVVAIGAGGAGLIGTCSRGGILAFISGSMILACLLSMTGRIITGVIIMSLIIAAVAVPRAEQRLMMNPTTDPSIQTRLSLVNSATMMIADQPYGYGSGKFGVVSESWYLDKYRGLQLWHPLNDALLLGSEHGVFALMSYYVCGLSLAGILISLSLSGNVLSAGSAASVVSLLVSGTFNCLLRHGGIRWYIISLIVMIIAVHLPHFRHISIRYHRWPIAGALLGMALTVSCWMWGECHVSALPWKPNRDQSTISATPRHVLAVGNIVVIRNDDDTDDMISRNILQPLIAKGYAAACMTADAWKASDHRRDAQFLLVLHGATYDGTTNDAIKGIIVLDADFKSLRFDVDHRRILLIAGSALASDTSSEALSQLRRKNDITSLTEGMPYCWPRYFNRFSDDIIKWMHDTSPMR